MTFRGEYRDGVIVPDEPLGLADGTRLEIGRTRRLRGPVRGARTKAAPAGGGGRSAATRKATKRPSKAARKAGTMYALLKPIIGKGKGLPADYSTNHDHYLFGAPKRKP